KMSTPSFVVTVLMDLVPSVAWVGEAALAAKLSEGKNDAVAAAAPAASNAFRRVIGVKFAVI
ncbi:hypothetical protein, partial [Rhizobium rhizoryzae]